MKQNEYLELVEQNKGKHRQPIEVLVQGRKNQLFDSVKTETRLVAKFNVTDISNPTRIIGYQKQSQFSEIEIDGVIQSSIDWQHTFDTTGEHIIKYTLNDPTTISQSLFSYCQDLTSMVIPDTITNIESSSFYNCNKLININIPSNVINIGDNTFQYCSNLVSIILPNGITSINNAVFDGCSKLTSVNIPINVTNIGTAAFRSCSSLTNITIPNNVTRIYSEAFYGCDNLSNIVSLATTAPTIENRTFQGVKTNGTLTVPTGSSGYNVWMGTGNYYLGKYNWTKIEQ